MPKNPKTIEGTAPSTSTIFLRYIFCLSPASSWIYRALPIPRGMATSMAPMVTTKEPTSMESMPNSGLASFVGYQFLLNKNLKSPVLLKTGIDSTKRTTIMPSKNIREEKARTVKIHLYIFSLVLIIFSGYSAPSFIVTGRKPVSFDILLTSAALQNQLPQLSFAPHCSG